MNDEHIDIEEMSAYLDGEAVEADRIAAHLDACPECARHYEELTGAVQQVRALPDPDVSPAFVHGVMAEIDYSQESAVGSFGRRFYTPLAVAAAVLVLVAVGFVAYHAGTRAVSVSGPGRIASQGVPGEAGQVLTPKTEDRLPEAIGGTSEDGAWDAADVESINDEDLAADVAGAGWLDMLAMNVDDEADVDTLLDSMDDAERESFAELLEEYLMENAET